MKMQKQRIQTYPYRDYRHEKMITKYSKMKIVDTEKCNYRNKGYRLVHM